ncbi:MAG: phosphoribosyltransferase family protein, partial [Bacteroidota bacterium]
MASDSEASKVQLHQLFFQPYLSETTILKRVDEMGQMLKERMGGRQPVFLVMLKGAFLFAADLIRASQLKSEIDFVRTASYSGTETTRNIRLLLPPDPELVKGRDIILVEDIVDSGYTMQAFLP